MYLNEEKALHKFEKTPNTNRKNYWLSCENTQVAEKVLKGGH